jgi:hypothetical protein
VILRPARTHHFLRWLRGGFGLRNQTSGPPVITRHEPRPAPKPGGSK